MSCARGCCPTQRAHYQSLSFASPNRANLTKTTADDHGSHVVEVKQHWADRQDVTVKPRTIGVSTTVKEI
jgi:hypothetical protein